MRELVEGRLLPKERVDQIIGDLGIAREDVYRFLREVAERDASGEVFGIMESSLNDTPHRFYVNGARMFSWCAGDALFVPVVLGQTATVESKSPVSGERLRLKVSPQGAEGLTRWARSSP
jgi:alkylmercury lyase